MKIWIDAKTGTYGELDELFIVDISPAKVMHWEMSGSSDSTISNYAYENGTKVVE